MQEPSRIKKFILIPLLIISLMVFNSSTFSVLAEEEEPQDPYCGDGNIDEGEQCDAGQNNGAECTPEYGLTCNYCSAYCETVELQGDDCGDGNL